MPKENKILNFNVHFTPSELEQIEIKHKRERGLNIAKYLYFCALNHQF